MPLNAVRVVARFTVAPDRVDEFVSRAASRLVAPSRREPGCLEYDLCQDAADRARFVLIETWETPEALDHHLARPELREVVAELEAFAAEPLEVQRLKPLG